MVKDIVFLKSLGLTKTQWYLQKKFFESKGYNVHTLNYISSNNMGEIRKDVEKQIEKIREKNKGKKINLVGLSMGGTIGIQIAKRHPEWIDKLVLSNTFHSVGKHKPTRLGKWFLETLENLIRKTKSVMSTKAMVKLAPYFGIMWGHGSRKINHVGRTMTAAEAHRYELEKDIKLQGRKKVGRKIEKLSKEERKKVLDWKGRQGIADHTKAIFDYSTSGKLERDFKGMKVPQKNILIMAGLTEYPLTYKGIKMKLSKPDAKFKMMFTGHLSNLENPKVFNKNLFEFFKKKRVTGKRKGRKR